MTPDQAPALQSLTRELGRHLLALPHGHGPLPPPHRLPAANTARGPALLARGHAGPSARQNARQLYERCLTHFRQRAQPGATLDDLGLAAAYFVLANLEALHGLQADEALLLQVEAQMRSALAASPHWQRASLAEQQACFEQLAIVGVLVAESSRQAQRQGPAAQAHVRQAARGYLHRWLGLNPERLTLNDQGLALALEAA